MQQQLLHPGQVRYVKPYAYICEAGDNAAGICRKFRMGPHRWRELAAANRHKMGPEVVSGACGKCFENLEDGEPLRIPAWWNDPVSPTFVDASGQVKAPLLDQAQGGNLDLLQKFIDAWKAPVATTTIPNLLGGFSPEQALTVVWSWWPYLKDALVRKNLPVPSWMTGGPPLIPSQVFQLPQLLQYVSSAVDFLKATGITNVTGPQIMTIPWTNVDWTKVPWGTLQTNLGSLLTILNAQHTTQPIQVKPGQWSSGSAPSSSSQAQWHSAQGGGTAGPYGGAVGTGPTETLPQGMAPDFANQDWTQPPWSQVSWKQQGIWDQKLVVLMNDQEAMACLNENPGRSAEMAQCPNKWADADLDTLKIVLCMPKGTNVCSLVSVPGKEPFPEQVEPLPPGGDPGGGFDPTGAKEEDNGASNTALYVGAGVVGVLLLGAVVASGGKR